MTETRYIVHKHGQRPMLNYAMCNSAEEANAITGNPIPLNKAGEATNGDQLLRKTDGTRNHFQDVDDRVFSIEKIQVEVPVKPQVKEPAPKYGVVWIHPIAGLQNVSHDSRETAEKFAESVGGLLIYGEYIKHYEVKKKKDGGSKKKEAEEARVHSTGKTTEGT
jgi:hypothetical protein